MVACTSSTGKCQFRIRQDLARASRAICAGAGVDARTGLYYTWLRKHCLVRSEIQHRIVGAVVSACDWRWRCGRAKAGSAPRTLLEMDFLLLVDDESRHGALRFAEHEDSPFLAPEGPTRIPPLVELPKLLSASERVIGESDTDEDLESPLRTRLVVGKRRGLGRRP